MTFLKFFPGNPFFLLAVSALGLYLILGRRRRPRVRVLAFNLIVIGLLCAVFDTFLVLRAAPVFRIESADFHHGLKPRIDAHEEWGDDSYTFVTNSLAMRDRKPREVPLDAGTKRVVVLGDSFVEGIGVDYENTFVGILEDRLRDSSVEMLNPSVISYSPKLYYHKMKYWLDQGLDVDELWVFIDLSDTQDEIVYESWTPVTSRGDKAIFGIRAFWYKGSYVVRWIIDTVSWKEPGSELWGGSENYYKVRDRWTVSPEDFRAWGEKGLALAEFHMDKLHQLCRQQGIELTVGVYPWRQQIRRREFNSKQVTFWMRFAEQRELAFVNLFPTFINEEAAATVLERYFFAEDIHWNEQGHRRIADAIWEFGIPRHR